MNQNDDILRRKHELWRRGVLRWKYHSGQSEINSVVKRIIDEKKTRKAAVRTTRRLGKTFFLSCFALEECLKERNVTVAFTTTAVSALKKIVLPVFNEILIDCPRNLRPKFNKQESLFSFHNGSNILLFGTDNGNAEKARGIKAKHCLFDEAGFIDDLEYIIHSIFIPTMTYGDGVLIAASTPPPTSDHYFNDFFYGCESKGASVVKSIWDNPRLTKKEILDLAESVGCIVDWEKQEITAKSITFRREFEAEIIVDPKRKIVPEFTDDTEKDFVKPLKIPDYCKKYTVIDFGFTDKTGITFGFYDFKRAKACVIADMKFDFAETGATLKEMAEIVLKKEEEIFGKKANIDRFADGDLIILQDIASYGLYISPVIKDDLDAQVNHIRTEAIQKRFEIDPSAEHTIRELKIGIWDKNRRQFARTSSLGHFDNLASFMYFLRHVDKGSNPFPRDYNYNPYEQYRSDQGPRHELLKIMGTRKW